MANHNHMIPHRALPKRKKAFFEIKTEKVAALGEELDLVYAEAGPHDGGVVIGVHGAPATHKMFKKMAEPLVEKGYRVILPNLPGMGWTPMPESGCYDHSPKHKADIIRGLIEALEIEEIQMICGHSMGVHIVVHLAALPSVIDKCKSVCFLSGPGVTPHKRVSPWSLYKYICYCLFWLCNIPLFGAGLVYATSFLFDAVGLRGKTKMSQVYSVYEVALFNWEEFAQDLALLRDHGMGALVVHGDNDWFIQLEIAEDNATRIGVQPENFVWYKDGVKDVADFKDDVMQRAMFVKDGDHFIFMKQADILTKEQLSLLSAIQKTK
ncbi:hypothetical protein BSL78_24220 [Apostichopus japonicus]|uniref:AB hydrolase-1 domain-containing protein n=1 Tax=Stichopus japonicus TaxID=307972 RepID=A0A2G8JTA9_STIJA|nr:hypothetical protein BSL78_24220 [Apostichopus japonicus]